MRRLRTSNRAHSIDTVQTARIVILALAACVAIPRGATARTAGLQEPDPEQEAKPERPQRGVVARRDTGKAVQADSTPAPDRGVVSRTTTDAGRRVWVLTANDPLLRLFDAATLGRLAEVATKEGAPLAGVTSTPDAVWLVDAEGRVYRIDPDSSRVEGSGRIARSAAGVVASPEAVWVDHGALGYVSRLDPSTGLRVDSVGVGGPVHDLLLAGGSLWVLTGGASGGRLQRLAARGSGVEASLEFPTVEPTALAAGFGHLWAHDPFEGRVYVIDPAAGRATAAVDLGAYGYGDGGLAVGGGSVWASLGPEGVIARIDPASRTVVGRIETGAPVADVAYGAGWVWAVLPERNLLLRIHPDRGVIVDRIRVPGSPIAVIVG